MTITLDRPTTARYATSARTGHRDGSTARPQGSEEGVTITLSVTLPAGTGDVESALIADDLRTHAQRLVTTRGGRTTVAVNSPNTFSATGPAARNARTLPPRSRSAAAVSPLRPRRAGIVSPNSPARRDAETARRRALQATAVSPSSPSIAVEDSLVIDLFGRRVRIDGQDVRLHLQGVRAARAAGPAPRGARSRARSSWRRSWAESPEDTGERTVDVHVRRVRTKLGRYRRLISTVRGSGYRLEPGQRRRRSSADPDGSRVPPACADAQRRARRALRAREQAPTSRSRQRDERPGRAQPTEHRGLTDRSSGLSSRQGRVRA